MSTENNSEIKIDELIISKRETFSLQITDDGKLVVRAPINTSDEAIKRIILKRKDWIERKRNEVLSRDYKCSRKESVNGEGFLYLGKYYKLRIVDKQKEPLILDNEFLLSKKYLPTARKVFINWYKERAYEKISERVEWYAKIGGFSYNKVNITNAQKRWASCSHKRNLNFSWRLIMAPLSVVDYVVVHELVHLKEKNHSKTFWNKVKILMPNYEKHNDWLKKNGHLLNV